MSGVQIHTQDPISPASAPAETKSTLNAETSWPPSTSTPHSSNGYSSTQPAAAVPTPTRAYRSSPPSPEPGAVPNLDLPANTAKPTVPPPPRAGEKVMLPAFYAPMQPYPSQTSQPLFQESNYGVPPASTTSITTTAFKKNYDPPGSDLATSVTETRANLEHPPGYVQDPHASEMTPEQRRAAEQLENPSDLSPSISYNDRARAIADAGFGQEESVWEMAKKGLKKTGVEASKLRGKIWDNLGGE